MHTSWEKGDVYERGCLVQFAEKAGRGRLLLGRLKNLTTLFAHVDKSRNISSCGEMEKISLRNRGRLGGYIVLHRGGENI